jgi:hypothetical protein
MGGIKVVYGISKAQVASITVTDGVVTAITTTDDESTTPATPYKFHTYKFRKQSSSMTSTYTVDDTNGVKYITTELTLNFAKQETAKRVSLTALINCESVFVVEDNNGKMWLLGYDNPVTVTAAEATTGTAYGDANQYSITLSDMSAELPMEVNISNFVTDQTTEA